MIHQSTVTVILLHVHAGTGTSSTPFTRKWSVSLLAPRTTHQWLPKQYYFSTSRYCIATEGIHTNWIHSLVTICVFSICCHGHGVNKCVQSNWLNTSLLYIFLGIGHGGFLLPAKVHACHNIATLIAPYLGTVFLSLHSCLIVCTLVKLDNDASHSFINLGVVQTTT